MNANFIGRWFGLGIGGLCITALVVACSGGSSGSPGNASSGTSSPNSPRTGSGNAGQRGPAASGLIAAVQNGSIEVQNSTVGQLTVDYTKTTVFTETLAANLSDIAVGSCVVAVASTATNTVPTSITVSRPVDDACSRGFGGNRPGGTFGPGSGRPTTRPTGFPSGLRSGAGSRPGQGFTGAVTTGMVTARSGNSITVAAVSFARPSSSSTGQASPTTSAKTITVGSGTRIEKDAAVMSTALQVGLCASAQGTTDTSGTVNATSIALSPASGGTCTAGFGGRFGSFGGGQPAGSGQPVGA